MKYVKRALMILGGLFVAFVALAILAVATDNKKRPADPPAIALAAPTGAASAPAAGPVVVQAQPEQPDHSASAAALRNDRLEVIAKLTDGGVFLKIEKPFGVPRVWVQPSFYALDFEMKEKFVGVVFAYYLAEDRRTTYLAVYDSKTGNSVGGFDASGLTMK